MGKNQRNWKTEHTPIDTKESRKVTPQKQKVLEICNDKITGLFLKLRCRHFFKTTCLKCFTWLKMSLTIMILQLILFISFRFFVVLLLEKLNTKRHAFFFLSLNFVMLWGHCASNIISQSLMSKLVIMKIICWNYTQTPWKLWIAN